MKYLALIFLLLSTLAMHAADGVLGVTNGTTTLGPGSGGSPSPRVWTNDPAFKDLFESNTIHPILRSEIRFGMGDGSLFLFGTSNGPSRLVIYNPNEPITSSPAPFENTDIGTRSLNIYNPDIGGVGQLNSVEIYAYKPNGTNDRAVASVLAFTADPGIAYGDGVLLDPFGDSGETSAFRFSSAYSNSIPANEDLFEIQNGHTNKFVLAGNGDLYWGADATVGYRPPTTNALPGQVPVLNGATPQQISYASFYNGNTNIGNLATTLVIAIGGHTMPNTNYTPSVSFMGSALAAAVTPTYSARTPTNFTLNLSAGISGGDNLSWSVISNP